MGDIWTGKLARGAVDGLKLFEDPYGDIGRWECLGCLLGLDGCVLWFWYSVTVDTFSLLCREAFLMLEFD
jgi:hypothetical protein